MKKENIFRGIKSAITFAALIIVSSATAQTSSKDKKIIADSKEAKAEFIRVDGQMSNLFANAYGYVIFPNVGKGGVGIGGAAGNGTVFQGGAIIGKAKLTQVSIGFQWGGQA